MRTRLVRRFAEERPIFADDIERVLDESLPEAPHDWRVEVCGCTFIWGVAKQA